MLVQLRRMLGLTIGIAGITLALMTVDVVFPRSESTGSSANQTALLVTPCPAGAVPTSREELDRCAALGAVYQEQVYREEGTAAALRPTLLPPTPLSIHFTPVPPGVVPPAEQRIYLVNPQEAADGPLALRGANSMWHIAALATDTPGLYCHLYVLARLPRENASAKIDTVPDGECAGVSSVYNHRYSFCPQNVGTLTITGVTGPTTSATGPTGTVTFSTSTGQTGTFDLATQVWTIDGVVVVAPTPVLTVTLPVVAPFPGPVPTVTGQPPLP